MHDFEASGYALIPAILGRRECAELASKVRLAPQIGGSRGLLDEPWCASAASQIRRHPLLSELIPEGHVAAQCTYFEKSAERNWLVPLHQDLSIPVAERVNRPGLRGWSQKEGALFVQAPRAVLEQPLAVQQHLEDCAGDAAVASAASSKATGTSLRRVLHFLFGPPALPFGLRWRNAVLV